MAPNPVDTNGEELTGDEIVITGISGYFPSTENTEILINNLYNKVDMVKKVNYEIKHPELPQYAGKLENFGKFDSHFFRFTHWQASTFDAIGRKNMEQAYSALFDSGINPVTLKGKKLGVFIGASQSDAVTLELYDNGHGNGFVISGCSKTMLANRISYWIDGKGPSYGLDYTCTSSIACLNMAVERIKAGDCDCAIVGGCSQIIHPGLTINMRRAGLLCLDGKTKCFDKNGDGYVRSEAINTMFIQKAKDAKRIYAQIYRIKGKHFSKPDALFLPSRNSEEIEKFLEEFYSETDVSPKSVEYIEANAVGIAEADEKEIIAIGNVFSKTNTVKIGCIKSNMGHTEAASGICALTKICLSYQKGEIPANLHYKDPHDQIDAIREKRVQVVTETTKFDRGFTALNNFSGLYKKKDLTKYKSAIPYLVLASGRLDKCVNRILDILENNPIDPEQLGLLNNIFKYNIPGHTGRGYAVIETIEQKSTSLAKGFEVYDGNTRPIWFLYSGMGSQWPTMGAELLRLPIFAASIEKCNKVLQTKGIDIMKIITEDNKDLFDNILNCFVGITSIQIALTDVLRSIGITPNNIIGHSAGEIGCAYADGCLNLEEAILLAYIRGKVSLEVNTIKGKMAAIGLGHKEVEKICPPELDIACENSPESTTVSGPAEDVEKFVAYLSDRSIFARTVASSGIAYHSRYIAAVGPRLLSNMKDVIKTPKMRSKNWLSTCFRPDQWSDERSLHASSEYFTHNILNTVHFEDTAKMIPDNAMVIEIAPHGLMQAIMKRSHKSCMNLSLTRRGEKNNIKLFLETIGSLYLAGLNPNIEVLYPKINYPVSTETSGLSHFVDWDHTEDWQKTDFIGLKKCMTFSYELILSIYDDDYSFYRGCIRNGKYVLPEAAILVTVWKTLAMNNGTKYQNTSVEFKNVKIFHELTIQPEDVLKISVEVQRGSNLFEVTQHNNIIATGLIYQFNDGKNKIENNVHFSESDQHLDIKDIYNLMSMKGYNYEGQFQSIKHMNFERTKGLVKWENNWVTFLDSLFQLNAINKNHNGVSKLKFITRLVIDVDAHENEIKIKSDKEICYGAEVSFDNVVTKSAGVLLTNLTFDDLPKVTGNAEKLQIKNFFPHKPHFDVDLKTALQVNLQILSEIIEGKIVLHYKEDKLVSNIEAVINEILEHIPSINIEIDNVLSSSEIINTNNTEADVLIIQCLDDIEEIQKTSDFITKFVIVLMKEKPTLQKFNPVTSFKIGKLNMVLFERSDSETLSNKRGGYYYIPELSKPIQETTKLSNETSKLTLKTSTDGTNSHTWTEASFIPNNGAVQVLYTAVYLNDYNHPVEFSKNLNKHGIGFSGINSRGDKVMGIVPDGSISNIIEPNFDFFWPVPNHWNLEEAATVPLPYIQAYYCLALRGNLERDRCILITNGDSPLGQAVISLSLSLNCTVFTTVDNSMKKKFLLKNFKKLQESHIGFNNDLPFRQAVLNATMKKRCDIVINNDVGEKRMEAAALVGFLRTFYDVSDRDKEENSDFPMAYVEEERTYQSVQLSSIFLSRNARDSKKLQLLLSKGIGNGSVKPITRVVYTAEEIPRAFKLLSTSNNIGSVLINIKDMSKLKHDCKIEKSLELPTTKSFIVVCDGSLLAIELMEHLVQQGARRFLIHMKPKQMNGYFHVKYASWKEKDVVINFNFDDLHTVLACKSLITESENMGCLDGIFIAQNDFVGSITDKIDENKVDISLVSSNLDEASRNCDLKYFTILLYTTRKYNNLNISEIERRCYVRKEIGLPSLILRYETVKQKILPEALSKIYNAMDTSLRQNYVSVFLSDVETKSTRSHEQSDTKGGLGTFINKICEVEYTANEPAILMKTLINDEKENELYTNPDEPHLLMIPGFDGNYQNMTAISERLKIRALTLQLEPDMTTSIPDIAKKLLTTVKKRINIQSKFYILGYSFGVSVALELAALFEKEGHTGVVFCLDSSPNILKSQLKAYTGVMTDQQLQNSTIKRFYNLLTGNTYEGLEEDFPKTMEWSRKIEMLVENIKGSVTYTHQFLKSLINSVYRRFVMANEYDPDFKLNSEIVLMKGVPNSKLGGLCNDYGLSKYSHQPVKIFNLEADHATATQDIRVSNIVNKMLDPGILEEFENKNLCQYYLS